METVILLAVLQGLTEFLPVSSSGHLVLFGHLLGSEHQGLFFDLVLHGGTLVVLLAHYRKDLWMLLRRGMSREPEDREPRRLLLALLLATGVTACLGLGFKDRVEPLFERPEIAASCLLVTGVMLLSLRFAPSARLSEINAKQALLIGVVQAVAILPGISRSGSTIVAAIWLGIVPNQAARYSFLLAIPAIGGALLLEARHLPAPGTEAAWPLLVGFLVAVVTSWVGLRLVLGLVRLGRLTWFGFYCLVLGGAFLLAFG